MTAVFSTTHPCKTLCRVHLEIQGTVQGVGFRPFVYGLAIELGLQGWVSNTAEGVAIEVEGAKASLEAFLQHLQQEQPPHAKIQQLAIQWLTPANFSTFEIRASEVNPLQQPSAVILPDLATCPACLREIFDPSDRRHRYPFTNCTHCGPRFSILQALPYDRPNTTMGQFRMCPACQSEYENPRDRRFHAQPNACPHCGPHLELWDPAGQVLATDFREIPSPTAPPLLRGAGGESPLQRAAEAIRAGKVVAIKGLGGFHLVVDASNESAVQTLRQRKHRPAKPLAVMFPSLEQLQEHCQASSLAIQLLSSSESPIVLLAKSPIPHSTYPIAPSVAPDNPYLGVMLPYTPLHHLLLAELGFPIVATSGNLSSEPICTDEQDALQRLGKIADLFLIHNRPIARPMDDSIVRIIQNQPVVLRRARGYAPLPVAMPSPFPTSLIGQAQGTAPTIFPAPQPSLPFSAPLPILALGAHLKNTIALALNQQIFASQHLGDLDNPATIARFHEAVTQLLGLYDLLSTKSGVAPALQAIACDAHPDYYSTQFADQLCAPAQKPNATPIIPIQHHYAHVLACMADNQLQPPVLGIAWDGTGYGLDGTIWGGEVLLIPEQPTNEAGFERLAHLRPFPLPGGEMAVKEPRRSALGLLYACFGEAVFERDDLAPIQAFSKQELSILKTMLGKGVNSPVSSSAGRLFDAIASLLGLCHRSSFEGQAAMQLEFALHNTPTDAVYPYPLPAASASLDWEPMVRTILDDLSDRVPLAIISATFHNTLVEAIVAIAQQCKIQQVALTGGCFQNQYLLERAVQKLIAAGFSPAFHRQIPSNDGGIAIGQILGAFRKLNFATGGV